MANRMHRNYDEAFLRAKASQKALIHYLRELRQAKQRWMGEDEFQALLLIDPKARDLVEKADLAWAVVELRRSQLMGVCHAS